EQGVGLDNGRLRAAPEIAEQQPGGFGHRLIDRREMPAVDNRFDGRFQFFWQMYSHVFSRSSVVNPQYPSFANGHPYRNTQLHGVDLITSLDPSAVPHGLNVRPQVQFAVTPVD